MIVTRDEPKRLVNLARHEMELADLDEDFFSTALIGAAKHGRLIAVGRLGQRRSHGDFHQAGHADLRKLNKIK
jgi:uncharacterized DUF497 family protein